MKKLINVTQEDIDTGKNGHPIIYTCPNARALTRELGVKCGFGTESWWIYNEEDGGPDQVAPEEAVTFAENFDSGGPVVPYSFEVEV